MSADTAGTAGTAAVATVVVLSSPVGAAECVEDMGFAPLLVFVVDPPGDRRCRRPACSNMDPLPRPSPEEYRPSPSESSP